MVDEARGDVDDVTASPAHHLRDHALGDVEEPGQVHRGGREVVLRRVLGEGLADVEPRVVDQGVDPTEPIERLVDHALCGPHLGDVTLDSEVALVVGGRHRAGDADDRVAGPAVAGSEAGADPSGGAGDDRNLHSDSPEREHVRLGAGLEEGDLQRPLPDRIRLAYELIQAAVPKHAVSVLVDVHAV
jgi:hypothetical protein